MSDAAWTGIGVIFAGLFTAGATVLQAKFSADKASKIAVLESEVAHLKEQVDYLKKCKDEIDVIKVTVVRQEAEIYSLKEYIKLLEAREKRNAE